MWKKPRSCAPEDQLYPDRGMLKWQGMLLSDHNERIRLDAIAKALYTPEGDQATEEERDHWDRMIRLALQEKRKIHLLVAPVEGKPGWVSGYLKRLVQSCLYLEAAGQVKIVPAQEIKKVRLD